jgi:hypothetical protein
VYATDLCGISSANSDITIGFPLNYLSTATGYFLSTMGDQPIPTDYITGIDIDTNFTGATRGDQYVSSASYFLLADYRAQNILRGCDIRMDILLYCRTISNRSLFWARNPPFSSVDQLACGNNYKRSSRRYARAEASPSAATKYRILIIPNILLLDPIHMEPLFPNPFRSNRALYLSCGMVNVRPRGIWAL